MSAYPQPLPPPVRVPCELCGLGVSPGSLHTWEWAGSAKRLCAGCTLALERVLVKRRDARKGEELT